MAVARLSINIAPQVTHQVVSIRKNVSLVPDFRISPKHLAILAQPELVSVRTVVPHRKVKVANVRIVVIRTSQPATPSQLSNHKILPVVTPRAAAPPGILSAVRYCALKLRRDGRLRGTKDVFTYQRDVVI